MSRFGSGHGTTRPDSASPNLGPSPNSGSSETTRNFLNQFNVSHALHPPSQVELRESGSGHPGLGVWAVDSIPSGSKFGPFLGKWCLEPVNPHQAWEVSPMAFNKFLLFIQSTIDSDKTTLVDNERNHFLSFVYLNS
jgi:hypothetical protein